MDLPADDFALGQSHRFGNGGRKVYVVLVCGLFSADELNFCRIPHLIPPVISGLAYVLEPRMRKYAGICKVNLQRRIMI